jgi:hypothetical protein
MAKSTLRDRIARYFKEGLRFKQIESKSRKYLGFESPKTGQRYWVGKAGGVRAGRCPSVSRSMTGRARLAMEKWERETTGK